MLLITVFGVKDTHDVDISQRNILPVCPVNVNADGAVLRHTVCGEDSVPETEFGSVLTSTTVELTAGQLPFFTTTL